MITMDGYINFILRRRWHVLVLSMLVTLMAVAGLPGLTVSSSYRVLFGEDNPDLLAFDSLQDTYSASRSALIAVSAGDETVFTRETLAAMEKLTEAAWQTPHSVRVDSLTNYSHSEAVGDDLFISPLVEGADSLTDDELDRIRSIALSESELVGQLVSEDGRTAGLVINFALSEPEEPKWAEIMGHLRGQLDLARQAHPDLDYFMTGNVVMNQAFTEASDDATKLVPIAFFVILLVATVLLRSVYAVLSLAVMLILVLLCTMGVAGWVGTMLTPVSASVPVIIMTVAVAHAIHVVTITLAGMRGGMERKEALSESMRENLSPVFLTSATTAIGFLSLNMSSSPSFHVLGNLVVLGILFTFMASVTVLPALLSILPMRVAPGGGLVAPAFERLGNFVVGRRRLLMWISIPVVVALAAGIPRNQLGDNWLHHFDESYEFRTDTDAILDRLSGLDALEFSLDSGIEGGITDPGYLVMIDAFAEWFRAQPEVHHVRVFSDIMKRVNENMHGDDPAYYRIPEDPELAAQFLLIYELSLPPGADLNDRMDISKTATRMSVVLKDTSTTDHLDLDRRARGWLQANAPELAGPASGFTMISAHMSDQNVRNMLAGTIIATALISFILLLTFRSIRIGVITLVPNFIPAIMSFGLWGYLVGHIGLGASVVTAIAIGIIVDDTIHFLAKYLKLRRQGLSSQEAVRSTFRVVGPALWTTTAILVLGFLTFATSGYEPSQALGILVALTVLFAFIADILLLPALLMAIDRKES